MFITAVRQVNFYLSMDTILSAFLIMSFNCQRPPAHSKLCIQTYNNLPEAYVTNISPYSMFYLNFDTKISYIKCCYFYIHVPRNTVEYIMQIQMN